MELLASFVRLYMPSAFSSDGDTIDALMSRLYMASHRAYSVDGRMPSTLASAPGFVSLDNISDGNAGVDSVVAKDPVLPAMSVMRRVDSTCSICVHVGQTCS
eukprot:2829954-Amphidinium_carterae.3